MGLRLHNTLTRTKEDFVPIDPRNIRMYVCGPTVYDFAHIGNARPLIVFDVLFRLLRHIYGAEHVTYVRNITDVDDKINARAAEEGISIRELTERTTKQFHEDVAALGCLPPTFEPRATEYVTKPDAPDDMIRLTRKLIERGNAYTAEGHVLFHVASMPDYGKLSNRSLDEMIAGARVEIAPYKKDPMDFVLWKPSKPGEPSWPSPWGAGRPGWHLECSAMAGALLGDTFDIHGGGIDLVFPHHENEIAQSRCAHGTDVMANYWLHNGFLQVEGEKMSKSLGNFVTVRDHLETGKIGGRPWRGAVLRIAMLQTHYREPIDWTVSGLQQSEQRLQRWQAFVSDRTSRAVDRGLRSEFVKTLSEDLNTPGALAILDQVCKGSRATDKQRYTVFRLMSLLGLKAGKTRVARLVDSVGPVAARLFELSLQEGMASQKERFTPLAQSLYSFSTLKNDLSKKVDLPEQRTVFSALGKPDARTLAASLWDGFRKHSQYHSDDVATQISSLQERLRPIIGALSKLSVNDWRNLAASVSRQPTYVSGEPKTETKLFAYLWVVAALNNQLNDTLEVYAGAVAPEQESLTHILPEETDEERRIGKLVGDRAAARAREDFAEADRIRDELDAMGIALKDSKDPKTGELVTTWEMKR